MVANATEEKLEKIEAYNPVWIMIISSLVQLSLHHFMQEFSREIKRYADDIKSSSNFDNNIRVSQSRCNILSYFQRKSKRLEPAFIR